MSTDSTHHTSPIGQEKTHDLEWHFTHFWSLPDVRAKYFMSNNETIKRKVIFVADAFTGISSAIHRYNYGSFPERYTSPIFCISSVTVFLEGVHFTMDLCEMTDSDEYSQIRTWCFTECHVVVFGYAVDCHKSLDNIETKVSILMLFNTHLTDARSVGSGN